MKERNVLVEDEGKSLLPVGLLVLWIACITRISSLCPAPV